MVRVYLRIVVEPPAFLTFQSGQGLGPSQGMYAA
jgi:hypothetical protein